MLHKSIEHLVVQTFAKADQLSKIMGFPFHYMPRKCLWVKLPLICKFEDVMQIITTKF